MGQWLGDDGQYYDSWDKWRGANNRYRQQQEQNKLLKEQNDLIEKQERQHKEKNRILEEQERERNRILEKQERERNRIEEKKLAYQQERDRQEREEREREKQEREEQEYKEYLNRIEDKKGQIENKNKIKMIQEQIPHFEQAILILKEENINKAKEIIVNTDYEFSKEILGKTLSIEEIVMIVNKHLKDLNSKLEQLQNEEQFYKCIDFIINKSKYVGTKDFIEDYEEFNNNINYKEKYIEVVQYEEDIEKKRKEQLEKERKEKKSLLERYEKELEIINKKIEEKKLEIVNIEKEQQEKEIQNKNKEQEKLQSPKIKLPFFKSKQSKKEEDKNDNEDICICIKNIMEKKENEKQLLEKLYCRKKELEELIYGNDDGIFVSEGSLFEVVECVEDKENGCESDDTIEDDDTDPLLEDVINIVFEVGKVSTSFIQERFKVGYARACRIFDEMERQGIISGYEGSKPRMVIMTKEEWEELKKLNVKL